MGMYRDVIGTGAEHKLDLKNFFCIYALRHDEVVPVTEIKNKIPFPSCSFFFFFFLNKYHSNSLFWNDWSGEEMLVVLHKRTANREGRDDQAHKNSPGPESP